jgi:hypothetical protein
LNVGYDHNAELRKIEMTVLRDWSDRVRSPLPSDDIMFRKRSRTLNYLDPAIWGAHPDLDKRARTLAAVAVDG